MNTTLDDVTNSSCPASNSCDIILSFTWIAGIAINSITIITNLSTNGYVLWLIVKASGWTMPSEFFVLNQSVAEILFCLCHILYFAYVSTWNYDLIKAMTFFSDFSLVARPLFQCCVCVERYLAVVRPLVYLRFRPLRYRLVCGGVVWLMVLGCCFGNVFGGSWSSAHYYTLLGSYLLLLSVMLFCLLAVLRALNLPVLGEGERERKGGNDVKRRAFKIILIILTTVLVSHLSYVVTISLKGYLSAEQFSFAFWISSGISALTGSLPSLLYLHRAGKLPCIKRL